MKTQIGIVLVLLSICSLGYATPTNNLKAVIAATNKNLPKKVDSMTELTRITLDSTEAHYLYKVDKDASYFDADQLNPVLRKQIMSFVCSDKLTKMLFKNELNISFEYMGKDDHPITNVLFKPNDCAPFINGMGM